MKRKNGFTMIEILSVIIILGVIMMIAVPAVSKYILRSDKSVYASSIQAYIETVRGKYEMKEYGPFLKEGELMIVPLNHIVLEKGDSKNSPYGEYDFNRSYIVIVPERNGYQYYATMVDSVGYGVYMKLYSTLDEKSIQNNLSDTKTWQSYLVTTEILTFKDENYRKAEVREIYESGVLVDDQAIVLRKINS